MSGPLPLQYLLGQPGAGVTAGTGQWVQLLGGPLYLVITTTGSGTITAGTLLIEETDNPNDGTGATPSQLSTFDCTTISGGKKNCAHVGPGAYVWIRARVSVAVVGGAITVSLAGGW